MKKNLYVGKMAAMVLVSMMLILVVGCSKKEAPQAPTHLTAELNDDCIQLSWRRVPNADFYRITVGFQIRDQYNEMWGDIYEVLLCETSDHTYNDLYPFEGMNYYKIEAVNEYGSSPCSEVSCDYPNSGNRPHFNLYPNPAMDCVTIEVNSHGMNGHAMNNYIIVESILGEVVFDTEVAGVIGMGTYTLNTAQFNAGIYLMHVNTEDGEAVKRFVIRCV